VEQPCATTVRRQQDILHPIVVDVGVCRASRHFRTGEGRAYLVGYFLEPASPKVTKQVWRLRIGDALLNALNFVLNVPVSDEDVGPSVIVVVEEEATEAKSHQCVPPNFRARRFVDEQAISFVVIERNHLVREVGDHQAGAPRAVVVTCVDAHAGAGHTVFTERDTG